MRFLMVLCLAVLTACGSGGPAPTGSGGPTLVAHGGGNVWTGSQSGIDLERSFEVPLRLGGGFGANIVTIASRETDADSSLQRLFRNAGYRNTTHLRMSDPQALPLIAAADVIYFDGGVQTRLMRKLNAHPEIRNAIRARYAEGAIIAGVSAGAAALTDLIICCDRSGQAIESRGLGLRSDIVFDQHYSERGREFRLDQVISRNPGLIGIGLDEEMSVAVSGDQVRVNGRGGAVTFVWMSEAGLQRRSVRSGSVSLSAL